MNNKTIADEWFDIAKRDLNSALFLCDMKPIPKEGMCFHCQQSAEKMLKGFIAFHGGQVIKTHDLIQLNKMCIGYDAEFNRMIDACIELTDYSVSVRYPYHIEVSEEDVKLAIISAQVVMNFVLHKI